MYTDMRNGWTSAAETLNKVSRDIFDYTSLTGVVGSDKMLGLFQSLKEVMT